MKNETKRKGALVNDTLLTVAQVALLIGWKACTVRKKILHREIGYVKLGRSIRVPESELFRLIEEGFRPAIRVDGDQSQRHLDK